MRDIKPLKYKELKGLSEKQLAEHHDVLYAGYVKKMGEIEDKLKNVDLSSANATHSDLRELKMEETFAINGVKLHEGYFENMTDSPKQGLGQILTQTLLEIIKMIERDFGSYENWEKEFKAMGLAARGWVILGYDIDEKRLKNVLCDSHNQGGVWNMVALLIMDVYEHAYFLDYATARKAYIESFFLNIDWNFVNSLLLKYNLISNGGVE